MGEKDKEDPIDKILDWVNELREGDGSQTKFTDKEIDEAIDAIQRGKKRKRKGKK